MASDNSTQPKLPQIIESFRNDVNALRGEVKRLESPETPFGGFASLQKARQLRTRFAEVRQQVHAARVQTLEAQSQKVVRPVKKKKEQYEKSDEERREEITAPAEGKYVVAGRFLEVNTGVPLPSLRVQVMERDPQHDDVLGEVRTDRYGFYRLEYTAEDFHKATDKEPETYVRVLDEEGNVVYTSDQSFRHQAGVVEVIDGAIEGDKVLRSAEFGQRFRDTKTEELRHLQQQVAYLENRVKLRTDPLSILMSNKDGGDS